MASQNPSSLVDLRGLEFLSPIDDNLLCSVCHCAFIRPAMTKCGHIFCSECYDSATRDQKETCPFCRSRVSQADIQAAPRALVNMADDLKVKCPNWKEGCAHIATRGAVQNHVDKYCEYLEVDCESDDCTLRTWRKDLGRGCLHREVECQDCQENLMGKYLDDHRRNDCPNRFTQCSECQTTHLVCDTTIHEGICPELVVSCSGSSAGCPIGLPRRQLPSHTTSCPFARLWPMISSQSARIQALEQENNTLRRKLDAFTSPTLPPMISNNLPPLTEAGSTSLTNHPTDHHHTQNTAGSSEAVAIELQTHLITSYESLRSDIDRLSASMSDLDARQSVLIMNESLRVKDDFAHLNAVVGSMRVQLHWLMSNRLQSQQRQQQPVTRTSTSAAAAAAATGSGQSPSAAVAGGGGASRGSATSSADEMGGVTRRLSESSRQETKL